MNDPIKNPYLPSEIIAALSTLTPDERTNLVAIWRGLSTNEIHFFTGREEFLGLRYFDVQIGKVMKLADEKKLEALSVLEEAYREDVGKIVGKKFSSHGMVIEWRMREVEREVAM